MSNTMQVELWVIPLYETDNERVEIRESKQGTLYAAKINKATRSIVWSKREYETTKALKRDLETSSDFWPDWA
jgi:hypothetical protein